EDVAALCGGGSEPAPLGSRFLSGTYVSGSRRLPRLPSTIHGAELSSIHRKFDGKDIETRDIAGWAWPELDLVDPTLGGAPRAQRDALKLLAVFIQHTDSKPEQQRLVCVGKPEKGDEDDPCPQPVMMVHDLGQTFGHANYFNRDSVGSVNL